MLRLSRRALLAAAIAAIPLQASAQEKWTRYDNERFGTSAEYPSRFRPLNPPENGDGQGFAAADGAKLSIWGSLNGEDRDLAAIEAFMREIHEKEDRITYRASGRNWFVLSGTRGDSVFYRRFLLSHRGEVLNGFEISYPAALAPAYAAIVARISKSLRPGRGWQADSKP